jgi:adenylate cyclase
MRLRSIPLATERVERRLAAIFAADVAGYSRLMSADEEGTHQRLKAHFRELINPKIQEHRGRIVKNTGDGMLAEFPSVVDAVRCAAEIQHRMIDRNADVVEDKRISFRIGVNLGDVIVEPEDIFGDGVNIAARLEALAEPGAICISHTVRDQILDKLPYALKDMGEQSVKNIARPVHAYTMNVAPVALLPAGAAPPQRVQAAARPSIVVLPFTNLSTDPEQQYFADGITDDLTTDLSRIGEMFVISRQTAFAYRNSPVNTKQIGRVLGVRYVLEGSVRRSGKQIRVNAQLIDAEADTHVWAERFDRHLSDLLDLQEEITAAIAAAMEPQRLKFERQRVAGRLQYNEDAYEFYQRGMWHHYRDNKADNTEAQALFRRALTMETQYPQATAYLAIAMLNAAFRGWVEDVERNYDDAYELADRAISIDACCAVAHYSLGLVCMWTRRSDRAMAAFREVIKLNPSFAAAYVNLGQMYLYRGRAEEALALAEKGILLSPRDPRLSVWLPALAGAHYQLQHYDEAVEAGLRSWTLNRNWPWGLLYVIAGLAQLGRVGEAQSALEHLKLLIPIQKLAFIGNTLQRLYADRAPVDHVLDGLRKAGFE